MDLLEQCELWFENEQYQDIIDALSVVPSQNRTSEQHMALAQAYIYQGIEYDDYECFDSACEVMEMVRADGQGTIAYSKLYGDAKYYKHDYVRALDYYLEALRLTKKSDLETDECQYLLGQCRFCCDHVEAQFPAETFKERVHQTWMGISSESETVVNNLEDAYQEKKHTGTMGDSSEAMEIIEEAMSYVNKGFLITYQTDLGRVKVTMISDGSKEELYELLYFVLQCPDELLYDDRWEFSLNKEPARISTARTPTFTIRSVDTKVAVYPSERSSDHVSLKVYAPDVAVFLNDEIKGYNVRSTMRDLIQYAVGQICYLAIIDEIEYVQEEYELTDGEYIESIGVVALSELHDKLKEAGFKSDIRAEEYLKKSFISYEDDGLSNDVQPMRADVFFGTTSTEKLISDYFAFKHTTFAKLFDDGVVAGFFGFKLKDDLDDDSFTSEVMAVRKRCEDHFSDGPLSTIHFTGGASGNKYCYIDFLNYDHTKKFIKEATQFFEQEELITEAFYAPMFMGVNPTILKGPASISEQFKIDFAKSVLGTSVD